MDTTSLITRERTLERLQESLRIARGMLDAEICEAIEAGDGHERLDSMAALLEYCERAAHRLSK